MEATSAPPIDAPVRSATPAVRPPTRTYRLPSFRSGPAPHAPGRSWLGLLLAAIVFLAATASWLWLVQDVPSRTAFIFFADAYPAPFAPPGWIDEDRDRFNALDGLTLQVESAGFSSSLSGTPWDGLEAAIEATRPQIKRSGVLIVDLRALGAVDPQGLPALIPPTADPFDAATWIPLAEFCRRIKETAPEAQQVSLILDGLPTRTRWASGWLYNDFPAAVETWAANPEVREEFARFTLFCRGGDGETRWRSQARRGSALQHTLWRGLAGEADDAGNANRQVELAELVEYLRQSMPERDPVAVFALGENHGALAHALPGDERDQLEQSHTRRLATDSVTSDTRLQAAWHECEELLHGRKWQQDLPATGRLLRALTWWEKNHWSGKAGVAESAATAREVTRWLSYLQRQSEISPLPPGAYPLLALQRHTGMDAGRYEAAETRANELALAEDRDTFAKRTRSLSQNELFRATSLRQMARLLAESTPPASWQQPRLIQQTLQQRQRFEALAVPEDIRVSRHLAARLGPLRDANLAAFDGLQIGTPAELASVADTLDAARQQFDACATASQDLHRQMAVCDRARLELPFLAEWAAIRDANAVDDKHRLVNRLLIPLIVALNDLDARLHPNSDGGESITSLASDVERDWRLLRSQFEEEWERLLKERHPSAADLDALEALLEVPLLIGKDDEQSRSPAEQRIVLLRKLVTARPSTTGEAARSSGLRPQDRMLKHWNTHPALALIGGAPRRSSSKNATPTPPADETPTLEDWNHEFRHQILAVEQVESSAVSAEHPAAVTRERLLSTRRGIALTRKSANVWAAEYRKLAWADLLLWLADSALTEFWGPEPDGSEPLLIRQAHLLLTVSSGLADSRAEQTNAVRQRLSACTSAANSGLAVDAASLTPVSPQDRLSTNVRVEVTRAGAALPKGNARIGIQRLGEPFPQRAVPVSVTAVRQKEATQADLPLDPRLVEASFDDASQPLLAEVWFRGNAYRSSFRIIPAGGRVTETDCDPTAGTTFTVQSRRMQGAAITFILDCSASMQEAIPREGKPGTTRKLTAAISALHGLLEEMTTQPEANVGVMLYGHRASHHPDSPKTLLQQRYASAFTVPDNLQPYNDVETILPPGRFGPAELGEVAAHLERLLPWGETPLYLAVRQAASEFGHLPSDVQRHIVVITDGRNYQFNPPPAQRVDYADALAGAKASGAVVHVIGFAMSDREQRASADEFGRLAGETGGTVRLDISRASQLIKRLRSLVGPASFEWLSADGKIHRSPVNEPVTWTGPLPARLTLKYEAAVSEIELHGGEAARLLGDEAANATAAPLKSAEYSALNPRFVPLSPGAAGQPDLLAGIHQPRRIGPDAVFEFSLQREDQLFLKRPTGYVVSIQPLDASGAPAGAPYRYAGREFVARRPVPVVRVRAQAWPASAPQASVHFSVVDADASSQERIALPWSPNALSAVPSKVFPGMQWEIRQTATFVQCILRHQPDSPRLGKLAVDWAAGPAVQTIRRRYDPDAQIEVHTFVYRHPEARDATAVLELTMPAKTSLRGMPRPLRLRLAREEGVIAPAAQARIAPVLTVPASASAPTATAR